MYVGMYVELTYHTHTYYVRTGCAIVWTMRYINVRHTYVYLCVYVYMCVCTFVCMELHSVYDMCTYVRMYVCTYV